jgi:hypothetical protein
MPGESLSRAATSREKEKKRGRPRAIDEPRKKSAKRRKNTPNAIKTDGPFTDARQLG